MGLHINNDETLIDLDSSGTPDAPPHLQGDLQSFALVRLVVKLINAIALPDKDGGPTPTSLDVALDQDSVPAQLLHEEFQNWYRVSIPSFTADGTLAVAGPSDTVQDDDPFALEAWYSHDFRAVTMLYYHMAKMLLVIYLLQPGRAGRGSTLGGGEPFDMLVSWRNFEQQLRHHSRQILAIVGGAREHGAIRVRSLQPLYVVGRTMTTAAERRQLVALIRSIEDDQGLSCEYRVKQLLTEWRITPESIGVKSREQDLMDTS